MNYPDKLIVVGMRYIPGALQNAKRMCPGTVVLRLEHNKEASDGQAYKVYLNTFLLGYVREKDLDILKRASNLAPSIMLYNLVEVRDNYLVLKLEDNKKQENPCNEIFENKELEAKFGYVPRNNPAHLASGGYIASGGGGGGSVIYKDVVQPLNIKLKEITMFDKIVAVNKTVAVTGAYMEAGRIANNQVTKLVAAKAPLMVKGYIDTPLGKVVLANLTMMAVDQFRPTDIHLKKVASAMGAVAYQELIQTIDIEGMLNELTSSEGIKAALNAVAGQEVTEQK